MYISLFLINIVLINIYFIIEFTDILYLILDFISLNKLFLTLFFKIIILLF